MRTVPIIAAKISLFGFLALFHSVLHMATMSAAQKHTCSSSAILSTGPLGFPYTTPDPFLFCVFHRDMYPAGNEKNMHAPRKGNGADFDWSKPYRMYHGIDIAGFPQHPHRGFETITATLEGIIDHTDSLGNAGRYGHGDVQWMTAGKGVVHGENFPLVETEKPNFTKFFQIWLNLPAKNKMADASFKMHWNENIPRVKQEGVTVHVWAGELEGKTALQPTPFSWAQDDANDVAIFAFELMPSKEFYVPAAKGGSHTNRALYFIEGDEMLCNGKSFTKPVHLTMDGGQPFEIKNNGPSGSKPMLCLLLQGRPIAEPVAKYGPFVMNTQQEIQQAFSDYRATQFGGWPWKDDAMVFPRTKGRFALLNGAETYPPV
jgi:redox-sensitive bicupin YhaK (pirin superfamily)